MNSLFPCLVSLIVGGCAQLGGAVFPEQAGKAPSASKTLQEEFCSSRVTVTIDPAIGTDPAVKKAPDSWKIECSEVGAGKSSQNQAVRVIRPTDSSVLDGLDPNYGDISQTSDEESYQVSSYQFNNPEQAFNFISGVLIVKPRVPAEIALSGLRKKYKFQAEEIPDGAISLKFEMDSVSLTGIGDVLGELQHPNGEHLTAATFSSINSAKLVKLYAEVQRDYSLVFEAVEMNIIGEEN